MTRALNVQWHSLAFSGFIFHEIFDNPLADETPQSRLKQIGMMSVLYIMHQGHQPLTLSNIVENTGLTRTGVTETIDPLVERGLLTERFVKNSMGRGKARQFEIAPELLEKIRALQGGKYPK
ncbi:MarR family transcriptional regulator [Sinorhizobium numidicum]|uniref:MarR family transcriptional regulator n=1 Tax=Sinorhizobium numidicum TaxID=680248 RepID=A0ABY8CSG5_9HYPH|nr:MarR family transcriptional regulator [Sinorhizobium numidicum]WEX75118.1 MarR family transcriptional regulator [Sinorhizobium numidicum]WEX81112.1 MarR family transcriptional regulator [Sinorhizobium numidicum]